MNVPFNCEDLQSYAGTVKFHFLALGLYNFIRDEGGGELQQGEYPGEHISGIQKMLRKDEIKGI